MDGRACVMLVTSVLVTAVAEQIARGLSPQEQGLRPGPRLEDLPPPDLIESTDRSQDPKPAELNATALRIKLGKDLDPEYMRLTKPTELRPIDSSRSLYKRNRRGRLVPVGEMPRHIRDMDFRYLRTPDGSMLRTGVSPKLKKKLQRFLWAYTLCPVEYRWKDLGIRFWPRWLKEGRCPAGKMSCSVPPGMKCKPSSASHKTFLRWHCKTVPSDDLTLRTRQKQCQWIKVEYPVVTRCACSCPNAYS